MFMKNAAQGVSFKGCYWCLKEESERRQVYKHLRNMVSLIRVYFSFNFQFGGLRVYVLRLKQLLYLGLMNDHLIQEWK